MKTDTLILNDKVFKTFQNEKGLASSETRFHYTETKNVIHARYHGGAVLEGYIIGKRLDGNQIQLLYHCITTDGELKAGSSIGKIVKNEAGLLMLSFDWQWLNGDRSAGKSEYIEVVDA